MDAHARLWRDGRTVFVLLIAALGIRLLTQSWDAGLPPSPHPDERRVVMVTEDLDGWFDDPEFFAYGSLHFQAVRLATFMLGNAPTWLELMRGGRVLSLVASLAALGLGWWLAREAWGRATSTLFLGLAMWVPIDQQLSHYATVEAHHAFWVMAALTAVFQLARTRSAMWAAAAGGAIGASLAVKVSSLGLLLPLGVALGLVAVRWGSRRALLQMSVAVCTVIGSFWIAQPWAYAGAQPPLRTLALSALAVGCAVAGCRLGGRWGRSAAIASGVVLLVAVVLGLGPFTSPASALGNLVPRLGDAANPAFVDGVREQVAMVTGVSDVPYVRVYAATIPGLYQLRELSLWALGPALVVVFLWALGRILLILRRRFWRLLQGRWNDAWLLLAVLLAWVVPMALRLSTLQVKFLRYWGPLVVPMVLVAAWGLTRMRRRRSIASAAVVVALTCLWGVAYLWAFADPHPFATASRWLRAMRGEDAVVAWEHWDESLPWIDGLPAVLESYNLPDDEGKVREWVDRLNSAEWVVLTSNRVRRTVLSNPDRFPYTGRLYRLLLAGEAGFEVVSTASRGPRVAGLRFPVQRADESFVNYEFPRVVLLRRVADVDPETVVRRAFEPCPELDGLTVDDLDTRFLNPAPGIPSPPAARRQLADGVGWVGLFVVCGMVAWVLLLPLLGTWPDAGVGLCLVTGWVASAWLLWLGSRLTGLPVDSTSATLLVLACVAVACAVGCRRMPALRRACRTRRRGIFRVLVCVAVVFVFFLAVRAFNPAIFWGEKPMDFAFFNAFVQSPVWPPGEPWMAGEPLHYYYFAEVLAAFPTLAAGAEAAVAYNLMCATVPAFAAAPLAGLGLLIAGRRRRRWYALVPVSVLLVGNLVWPWLLDLAKQGRWFDLWWATSRVVPGYAIDEYPLWTALFADLHAHFVALPVMVAALMWAWVTVATPGRRWWAAASVCGVTVGVLAATNPWDLLLFGAACLAVLIAVSLRISSFARLSAAALISVAAVAPFVGEMAAWLGGAGGIGGRPLVFLTRREFAPWWSILGHFGLFLIPLTVAALCVRPRRPVLLGCLAAGAAGLGLVSGSSAAALALGLAVLFWAAGRRSRDRWLAAAWSLACCGLLGIAFAERCTVLDRMNTVFKIYNGVWLFLAVAVSVVVLRGRRSMSKQALLALGPLLAIAAVNLPLGVAQGWMQPRMPSPRPTLDGRAYLAVDPQDRFLIEAVRGSARPGDVVAEAAGPSYLRYARIAMNTGRPTVVGWQWHLQQRGQELDAIMDRFDDLGLLYSGSDPTARRAVLDRYRVAWVVVGDLERETYDLRSEDPLAGIPGVERWARRGRAILYRVLPNSSPSSRCSSG